MKSKILIGLVTHPKSTANPDRYREAIDFFTLGFEERGHEVKSIVSADNFFNGKTKLINLWISKWANIQLVQNWMRHVQEIYDQNPKQIEMVRILDFLRRLKIVMRFALSTIISLKFRQSEMLAYTRNVNISLSHERIMQIARTSPFDLVMILEDDSILTKNEKSSRDLVDFAVDKLANSKIPALVSFSESLPLAKLFVTNSEGTLPFINVTENIYFPKVMHHNTVCAVIYNQIYIQTLNKEWKSEFQKLIYRGVPIDWIINALVLSKPANSLLTFHSHQNLITQGSIHNKIS